MECGTEIRKMNFILPHSFELDLRRECHYLVHRSFSFGVIQIRRSVQKLSSLGSPSADLFEREGFYFTDCSVKFIDRLSCNRIFDAQDWLIFVVFLYGGNIPFVVSLYFASQRIPTACPCCAGSISTIGLAPFCLKSAGLALIWASAVLLWFLALLYIFLIDLSIRRVHNKSDILLHQKSKFLGYMNSVLPVHCSTFPAKALPRRSCRAIADTAPAY